MDPELPLTRIKAHVDRHNAMNLEQTYDVIIFDKEIYTTITAIHENANDWIEQIEIESYPNPYRLVVGLDIKPRNPHNNHTALLVLCVYRSCLVFEHTFTRHSVPTSLARFLSDPNNTFVGVDIDSKFAQLQRDYGLGVGARRVDLGALVAGRYNRQDLEKAGLSELRMFLHGRDVERPVVADHWDAVELSNVQVHHACIDAYVGYELGSYLVYPIKKGHQYFLES